MDVLLQSLLLAGIGVCLWLAFSSVHKNTDGFDSPTPGGARPIVRPRRAVRGGEARVVPQPRALHDDSAPSLKGLATEADYS